VQQHVLRNIKAHFRHVARDRDSGGYFEQAREMPGTQLKNLSQIVDAYFLRKVRTDKLIDLINIPLPQQAARWLGQNALPPKVALEVNGYQ
jgi:hypothetical protein